MADIPFADFGLKWFEDIVDKITDWFQTTVTDGLRQLTNDFFGTPLPDGNGAGLVFGAPPPSDEPWHSIYGAVVTGEVMVLALIILFLTVQGRHFIRIFNFSSAYEDRRTRRSAWTGAILIVGWYWLAVLSLYFVEGLTIALIPDLNKLGSSIVDILPAAAGNPGLTLLMAMLGGLSMVALKAIYFIREVLLYVYLYGMPIGIAIAYGNLPILSRIARRLSLQFIPLAVLPLPAAVLFRGYELLFVGEQFVALDSNFLKYLVVISLPVLALYVTWKTFRYASPLAAQAIGTSSRAALIAGTALTAGAVAGPYAATTAARYGPKAGAAYAVLQRSQTSQSNRSNRSITPNDNVADDGGVPSYRRSENDPAFY